MKKPCIICVAITGSVPTKADNPAVPITVDELKQRGFYTDRVAPVIGKTLEEGYRFRTKSGKIELRSARYE